MGSHRGADLLDPRLADHTHVVRTPQFLSQTDIETVHAVAAAHIAGRTPGDFVDTPGKWYLQDGGVPSALRPIISRIAALATRVDADNWGILDDEKHDGDGPLLARCVEYHQYHDGGRRICGVHCDAGSVFTADLMLSHTTEFEGGALLTHTSDGDGRITATHRNTFERGDCVIFISHKKHSVEAVRSGQRDVLVVELWQECECAANHRCMGAPPCMPVEAASDVDEPGAPGRVQPHGRESGLGHARCETSQRTGRENL